MTIRTTYVISEVKIVIGSVVMQRKVNINMSTINSSIQFNELYLT